MWPFSVEWAPALYLESTPTPKLHDDTKQHVVNFLASLHKEGYQYNSINSCRSAFSSVHEKVDGFSIGQHPLVTKLLKGVFHDRPPLPRYTATWKVDVVLGYLKSLCGNESLSLIHLTWKTTMLLALIRPSRLADLSNVSVTRRQYRPEGVAVLPSTLLGKGNL